jgi:hypothetical protein
MYANITRNCPPWVNEGLAEYFEYAVQGKEIFRQDVIVKTHVITLKKAMRDDSLLPLPKLLKMKTDEWNHNLNDRSLALIQYAQSWSVVHFLICGNNGNRKDDLKEYLKRIKGGKRGDDALEGSFGKRLGTFEKDWMLHLEKVVK